MSGAEIVGKSIVTNVSVQALQASLEWLLTKISASEILFVCGDFIGHIEKNADRCEREDLEDVKVAEDLKDVIWNVRELLNLSPTIQLFQIHMSRKGRVIW